MSSTTSWTTSKPSWGAETWPTGASEGDWVGVSAGASVVVSGVGVGVSAGASVGVSAGATYSANFAEAKAPLSTLPLTGMAVTFRV